MLSDKLMNVITLFVTISLIAIIIVGVSVIIMPTVYAQENNLSSSQSQNTTTTTNTATEQKTYILIFGQRTVGNIDNSTRIVSSIVGNNSAKIQEEFLEEISLAPSQQLKEQVNKIVSDGIRGLPCLGVSLTTQEGKNVSVDCISSGNKIIWYIYPVTP
jgi:predicted PurR-regulated permease PerM